MATYTLSRFEMPASQVEAFVARGEAEDWSGLGAVPPVGVWRVTLGRPSAVLLLTRFESLQHWHDATGGARAGEPPFEPSEVIALRPITRRQPEGPGPEAEPGIYTMRTFTVARADLARFAEVSEEGWWPWVEAGQGGVRPLGQWSSIVAAATRVYMMARYDDPAHWEASRAVGPRPEDPALAPVWERASAAIAERHEMVLSTEVLMMEAVGSRRP